MKTLFKAAAIVLIASLAACSTVGAIQQAQNDTALRPAMRR